MISGSVRGFSSYVITPKEFNDRYQEFLNKAPSDGSPYSRIVPICASWFLPNDPEKRTGKQVFEKARIPGARFFDIDEIKSPSPYPHMLPSATAFAEAMQKLDVTNTDTIVVYDSKELGIFSAPRVAWTFKVFGHHPVHILNNYKLYVEEGFPVVQEPIQLPQKASVRPYRASEEGLKAVVGFEYMKDLAQGRAPSATVLDARPKARFDGTADEPRPGLSAGHMPRSISLPFTDLLDPQTKAFLPPDQLRAVLNAKDVLPHRPIISSCGTGVSAAVVDAALTVAGYDSESKSIYDGSWTEWAQRVKPEEELILKNK